MTKRCTQCKVVKPLADFPRRNRSKDGLSASCRSCCATSSANYRNDESYQGKRTAYIRGKGRVKSILHRVRARAKRIGLECTISEEDIVIPDTCPILGIPLITGTGKGAKPGSISVDRKDSARGYTPDNIQVISQKANIMKSDATPTELLMFADWVYKTYGGGSDH